MINLALFSTSHNERKSFLMRNQLEPIVQKSDDKQLFENIQFPPLSANHKKLSLPNSLDTKNILKLALDSRKYSVETTRRFKKLILLPSSQEILEHSFWYYANLTWNFTNTQNPTVALDREEYGNLCKSHIAESYVEFLKSGGAAFGFDQYFADLIAQSIFITLCESYTVSLYNLRR